MTVVFKIKDLNAMEQLYQAHKTGSLVCGMSPETLAWGDQIKTPSEIVEGLMEIDPDHLDKRELKELCDLAEKHRKQ